MIDKMIRKWAVARIRKSVNKTTVELCINDETELYHHLSVLKNEDYYSTGKINNEIIEYLINETESIPLKNALIVSVKIPENAVYNIELIEKLIKEDVKRKLLAVRKNIKKITRNSIILAVIGMIFIGFTQVLQFLEKRPPLNELIIVMSWVFMWKATELVFFERTRLMKENRVLAKIYLSEIFLKAG